MAGELRAQNLNEAKGGTNELEWRRYHIMGENWPSDQMEVVMRIDAKHNVVVVYIVD